MARGISTPTVGIIYCLYANVCATSGGGVYESVKDAESESVSDLYRHPWSSMRILRGPVRVSSLRKRRNVDRVSKNQV